MHPSRWLVSVCLAFLIGNTLGGIEINWHPWVEVAMGVALGLAVLSFPRSRESLVAFTGDDSGKYSSMRGNGKGEHRVGKKFGKLINISAVIILSAGLGLWRMENGLSTPNEYQTWNGNKQEFEGLVVGTDKRSDRLLLNVRPDGHKQLVQLRLSQKFDVNYGDRVWVRGKFAEPKGLEDFDYQKFLAARGIYSISYYPKTVVLQAGQGNVFLQRLIDFKEWLVTQAGKRLSPEARGLVLGVLIGNREHITKELEGNFTAAGLSHILVASGYNLTVLAGSLAGLAGILSRRAAQVLAALAVVAFVGMAGAGASVVRAGIMASLVIMARLSGRQYSAAPSLLLAASLMVAASPLILLWDAGFQLSFAATAGIIFGVPLIEKRLSWIPKWLTVGQHASTSIAAILSTLPLILYHFGRLSLVALPANLLVVMFVPALMLLGGISLLPFFGSLISPFTEWLASYMAFVGKYLATFKFASLEVSFSLFWLFLGYAALFISYTALRDEKRPE